MHEIKLPQLGQSVEEAKITEWFKKEGESVQKGEPLFAVETDKAEIDCEATESGILRKILIESDGPIPVMTVVALVGDADEDLPDLSMYEGKAVAVEQAVESVNVASQSVASSVHVASQPEASSVAVATFQDTSALLVASPRASATALRLGVALDAVVGTGANGRIVESDVVAASSAGGQRTVASRPTLEGERIPLTPMRQTVARRMSESKFDAPHFYATVEVDMTKAAQLRKSSEGFKPSYNDIILHAAVRALQEVPTVNAHWAGDAIVQADAIHIGFAVALPEGLLVPVIRNAGDKALEDLHREATDLAERAKSSKLLPDEYSGSTFTVSNLGGFGVDHFTAIINSPDSAILAVGMIQERPVVRDGNIEARPLVKLTLSSDHRVIDGAVAAMFLQALKRILEDQP